MRDLYVRLRHDWNFSRTIEDRFNNRILRANGQASFQDTNNQNILIYRETGSFFDPIENANQFFRSYRYIFKDDKIDIFFADGPSTGQIFHSLYSKQNPYFTSNTHLCGDDIYDGLYHFNNDNALVIHYKATGPHKNYEIVTDYSRV